jgi:hypothetical protein
MTAYKTVFFYLICRDGRDGLCLLDDVGDFSFSDANEAELKSQKA